MPETSAPGFGSLSRRKWLKLSLAAGGAVLGGGVGGVFLLRGAAPAVAGLKVLSAHEYRTMASLAVALLPRGGAFAFGAEDRDLARDFDGYLADEPEYAQSDARSALTLLELGPLIFERRLSTFSHLSATERLAHWATWATSASDLRRQVSLGFHTFLATLFYDSPAVWPALGYDGPLIKEAP